MYRTLFSIAGAWALLSAALAYLLWHKLQAGSNGSLYDFSLPALYAVPGVLLLTIIEALLLWGLYGLRWWRTVAALLLANALAAVGMLLVAGYVHAGADLDGLATALLLLPPAQSAIMLLLFLPLFAWLMRNHGRSWDEIWRVAALLQLSAYAIFALISVSTGSYSLLRMPLVDVQQLPLPAKQAVYFRASDGGTVQRIHLARPLQLETVPVLPRVRWPSSNRRDGIDCRLPVALSPLPSQRCPSLFKAAKYEEGLLLPTVSGDKGYLKLVTLGVHLRVSQLFDLGNGLALFQLGRRTIVIYDARNQRLAVLAHGSAPVVAGEAPARLR